MPYTRVGELRLVSQFFNIWSYMEMSGSASRPGNFSPEERIPGSHWLGTWMGPRVDLDAMAKNNISAAIWNRTSILRLSSPLLTHYITRLCRLPMCYSVHNILTCLSCSKSLRVLNIFDNWMYIRCLQIM
jgi:hypothetical protein